MSASHCKSWLKGSDRWYGSQNRSAKPATHTFLCGGIAVLQNDEEYVKTYRNVARDVVENEGRVCICENFPRITGAWPVRLYPPPHLIFRAAKLLRLDEKAVPAYLIERDRIVEDRRLNASLNNSWTLCTFAMDFDYKEINGQWFLDDLLADVRVIQRTILECGKYDASNPRDTDAAMCMVCIAYHERKLGMHLYFTNARYYPEQCMHLATICISRLQEERPVPEGCTRSWHEIVDLIYNGSLRLPLVQKAKKCPSCENTPKKRAKCHACHLTGFTWSDRRYYPYGMLDGNGKWRSNENKWIDPMVDFIQRAPGSSRKMRAEHLRQPIPERDERIAARNHAYAFFDQKLATTNHHHNNTSNTTATAASSGAGAGVGVDAAVRESAVSAIAETILGRQQMQPVLTKEKCMQYVLMFQMLTSLRVNTNNAHTHFDPSPMMPRPNYPKSWIHFFESVLHATQPPPSIGLPLPALQKRVLDMRLTIQRRQQERLQRQQQQQQQQQQQNKQPNKQQEAGVAAKTGVPKARPIPRLSFAHAGAGLGGLGGVVPGRGDGDDDGDEGAGGGGGALGGDGSAGVVLDGVDAQVADIVGRLAVVKLNAAPWANPGGALSTANHTVTRERESWEERRLRSKFRHLLLSGTDDLEVAKKMSTGTFGEFRDVETICNDPEGRCKRVQAYLRTLSPRYSQIQVLKMHISLKFKNHLVQVGGPGRHYCKIAGRNHRNNVITFQVKRQGQVLHQHCFHPQCVGKHHNWGAILLFDLRVLLAPGETLKECEKKATPAAVEMAKQLQKTSKAHSTPLPKRSRRKGTEEAKTTHANDEIDIEESQSLFGPNAPTPLLLLKKPNPTADQKHNPTTDTTNPENETNPNPPSAPSGAEMAAAGALSSLAPSGAEPLEPPDSPFRLSDCESDHEDEEDEWVSDREDDDKHPTNAPNAAATATATAPDGKAAAGPGASKAAMLTLNEATAAGGLGAAGGGEAADEKKGRRKSAASSARKKKIVDSHKTLSNIKKKRFAAAASAGANTATESEAQPGPLAAEEIKASSIAVFPASGAGPPVLLTLNEMGLPLPTVLDPPPPAMPPLPPIPTAAATTPHKLVPSRLDIV